MDISLDYDKRFRVWLSDVPEEICASESVPLRIEFEGGAPKIVLGKVEIVLMQKRTLAYPTNRDDNKTDEVELEEACDGKA